jgi:hypothetical protein
VLVAGGANGAGVSAESNIYTFAWDGADWADLGPSPGLVDAYQGLGTLMAAFTP